MEDAYKIVRYRGKIPVLGQTKLTHRDRELVRRIDSLRRVPRAELARFLMSASVKSIRRWSPTRLLFACLR